MAEAKKYVEQDMVAAKESGHKETIANRPDDDGWIL